MIAAGLARTGTKVAAMRRCVPAMLALLAPAGCGQSDDRACRASAAPTRTPFDCELEA